MNDIGSIQTLSNRNDGDNLGHKPFVSVLDEYKKLDINTYTILNWIEIEGNITQEQMEDIIITQGKRTIIANIPAKGGYTDEYWEVDMGNEIVRIRKPKDPVADLGEMGKNVKYRSVEEAKEQINRRSIKELGKKLNEE